MSDNKNVVRDALKITTILNKHLDEDNCRHTVKEIAAEAFD